MIPTPEGEGAEIRRRLAAAVADERAGLALRWIEVHPEGRLELPSTAEHPTMLDEVDLSSEALGALRDGSTESGPWWDEDLRRAQLRGADLRGAGLTSANLKGADLRSALLRECRLGRANLEETLLEEADLQNADLFGASLKGAVLSEANLRGAMLEEAGLQDAVLRFADLRSSVLESADLRRADLWGARLEGAVLSDADLRDAVLSEASLEGADLTGADLRGAELRTANFRGALLKGADLRGADVRGANFEGAFLRDAQLQGLGFTDCAIAHIHIGGAWLEKTRLGQEQLGGAIGEDLAGEYEEGRKGYLALERNFRDLGDPDAASWAYRKRRRMQKWEARQKARSARSERKWRTAAAQAVRYAADQLVEWLCDYGESVPRVLCCVLGVYLLFTALYGLTGGVLRVETGAATVTRQPTVGLLDLAVFSLTAMTTSGAAYGAPTVQLLARNEYIVLLTGIQALLEISLTGLLGFVAGNRIRR